MPIEMLNDDFNDETNKFSTVASYILLEGALNSKTLSPISLTLMRIPYDLEKEIDLLKKSSLPSRDRVIQELRSATNYSNMK